MNWFISPSSVGIVDFPTYLVGTILTILFPGPNSLYVLTIASLKGWRAGAWASFGIFIGDAILMLGVALGAASLLSASSTLFNIMRAVGAAYLVWLGYGFIRDGVARWRGVRITSTQEDRANYLNTLHPSIAALLLSLTNPKAIFFFISFFSQFIKPDNQHPVYAFLYLAIVLQVVSMAYLSSLIVAGQFFLSYFQKHPRYSSVLWILVGTLLVVFGGKLLL
ncbi:leucine efflux protein LeuE [Polynucleobacter sp. es-EL-1]|uniref:leucine efflux protein LeuE n=1 Tax=Polynucleobacter sp. es-EL-1 TaxID=1855652 RepID=UPI001BFEC802|nr:leucine efflux protein LeuE [Polynucleobacter sp. es-EL-1]QWE11022.1 leucine efflux protein LeuE [Polynucleobacter sp. es-EL-1]